MADNHTVASRPAAGKHYGDSPRQSHRQLHLFGLSNFTEWQQRWVSFDMCAFSLVCLCFSFLQRPAKLDAQPQHFCSVFSVSRMCLHKGNTQLSRVLPCVLHVFFFMAILVNHLAKLECSYSGSISNHCSRM